MQCCFCSQGKIYRMILDGPFTTCQQHVHIRHTPQNVKCYEIWLDDAICLASIRSTVSTASCSSSASRKLRMSWMLTLPCNYNKNAKAYIARVMRVQNMMNGEFNVDAVNRTTGTEQQEIMCSVFPDDCSTILDIHDSKPTDSRCSYFGIVNLHIKHVYNRFKKYHHLSVFQSNCANTN
jgi:hypothetical protein